MTRNDILNRDIFFLLLLSSVILCKFSWRSGSDLSELLECSVIHSFSSYSFFFFSCQAVGRHQIRSRAQDRHAPPREWHRTWHGQGQEAHTLTAWWWYSWQSIRPHFLSFNFRRNFVVVFLFSEHKHASCLFHKLRKEQTRLFLLVIHQWFSDGLYYTCVRIS